MADRPQDQLDINSLLTSFSTENAGLTHRAIVAEERCKAKDRIIDELVEQLSEKERVIEQLQRDTNDTEIDDTPDPQPAAAPEPVAYPDFD